MPGWLPIYALAFAAGIGLADRFEPDPRLPLSLGVASLVAAASFQGARSRAFAALLLFASAGGLCLAAVLEEAARHRPERRRTALVEAWVCRDASRSRGSVEICDVRAVEPGAAPVPERLRLHLNRDGDEAVGAAGDPTDLATVLQPGRHFRLRLVLGPSRPLRNPGAPDSERRMARRGLGGVARLEKPGLWVRRSALDRHGLRRWVEAWRERARARLQERGAGGRLACALAVGDPRCLAEGERDIFVRLGAAHLLAVSGLHLGLLAGLVYLVVRGALARVPPIAASRDARPLALWCALAAAFCYALFAGFGVPVRRALVLLGALLLAWQSGRPARARASLGAAALLVLWMEPAALFEAGPQLSFVASAALAGAWRASPARLESSRAGTFVRELLRSTATACLATAPLLAAHALPVAPIGLVANLLLVPWMAGVLIPLSLAAAAIAGFPRAGETAGGADSLLSELVVGLASLAAEWTSACVEAAAELLGALPTPSSPPGWVLVVCALLAVLGLRRPDLGSRVAAALCVALVLRLAPPATLGPPPPRVVVLDVGLGDATLVQGEHASLLVDGGGRPRRRGPDIGERNVVPALRALAVASLEVVVASHADLDHRGGLPAVLEAFSVAELWLPPGGARDPDFAELCAIARRSGTAIVEASARDSARRRGDLAIEVLWPPGPRPVSRNEGSLVLAVELAGRRVLLTGDVGRPTEAALLRAGVPLGSDLLKLGHHGSRGSSDPAFLRAVGASVVWVSAPCERRYGPPHGAPLERARESGAALWWTGRDGALFASLGPTLAVWSHAEPRSCLPAR